MKDLSITQEYMICTVNGKGTMSSYNQKERSRNACKRNDPAYRGIGYGCNYSYNVL